MIDCRIELKFRRETMVCYHGKNNEISWSYCEKCPVNHDCLACNWDIPQNDEKTEQTKRIHRKIDSITQVIPAYSK